jgi:hypothetical protein
VDAAETRQERRQERRDKKRTAMRVHGLRYVRTVLSAVATKAKETSR